MKEKLQNLILKTKSWLSQLKKPTLPRLSVREKVTRLKDSFAQWKESSKEKTFREQLNQFLEKSVQKTSDFVNNTNAKKASTYFKVATVAACAYITSDLVSLGLDSLIPDVHVDASQSHGKNASDEMKKSDYQSILSRNLLNTLIPGADLGDPTGKPVRSRLSYDLVGLVLVEDPRYSIATLQNRSDKKIYPVRETEEIIGVLKVTKVEKERVVFVNLASRKNEFIEIPDQKNVSNPIITPNSSVGSTSKAGDNIEQVSQNRFRIPRTEIDAAVADMNKILTQARAIPHFKNGKAAGFKLIQIVPNSLYTKLGLKNGDVITAINGEPIKDISDASKAFELFSELSSLQGLELNLERSGKQETFTYDFN